MRETAVELIDESYPAAKSPPVHTPLYPFQLRMIREMRNLEKMTLAIHDPLATPRRLVTSREDEYEMMMGVLSEARGGHMESTVLGHIANHPRRVRNELLPVSTTVDQVMIRTTFRDLIDAPMGNLILVPMSKLFLWTKELARFPTLRSMVLPHWTPRLAKKYTRSALRKLDVLVVPSRAARPFLNDYSRSFWTRVVIDEADTIDLGKCPWINTAFTWLVTPRIDNIMDYSLGTWGYDRYGLTTIASRGYVRDLLHKLHVMSDPLRDLLDHVCLSSDESCIDAELGIDRHDPGFVPLPHTDFDDPLAVVAQRVHVALEEADAASNADACYQTACETMHMTSTDLNGAISTAKRLHPENDRLGHPELRGILQEKCKGTCDMCMEEFDVPVFWPCCQNFTCLRCAGNITRQPAFQASGRYPWAVKCPFCRRPTATRDMCVLSNKVRCKTPAFARPLMTVLDTILSPNNRTLLFTAYSQTGADIARYLATTSLRYKVLEGKFQEIEATLRALKEHALDVVLWCDSVEPGFAFEADQAVGVDMSILEFADLTETHRFTPRLVPGSRKRKREDASKRCVFLSRSCGSQVRLTPDGQTIYETSDLLPEDLEEDVEDLENIPLAFFRSMGLLPDDLS